MNGLWKMPTCCVVEFNAFKEERSRGGGYKNKAVQIGGTVALQLARKSFCIGGFETNS